MLRCWRTKVANFRNCPPVSRRRALMDLLCVALRIEFEHPVVLVHSRVRDRLRPREMIGLTTILGICLGFKCEVMAEFSVRRLCPVWALYTIQFADVQFFPAECPIKGGPKRTFLLILMKSAQKHRFNFFCYLIRFSSYPLIFKAVCHVSDWQRQSRRSTHQIYL